MSQYEQKSEERGLPLRLVVSDDADRRRALASGVLGCMVLAVLVVVGIVADPPVWLVVVLAFVGLAAIALTYWNVRVWAGWGTPQLYLPSSAPLRLGDRVVARFRRPARRLSDTAEIVVTARLEAHEVDGRGVGERVELAASVPVEVTSIALVDSMLEADLVVDVPLADASPSLALGTFAVRWRLIVEIATPGAPDDDSVFPVSVAAEVAERVQHGPTR